MRGATGICLGFGLALAALGPGCSLLADFDACAEDGDCPEARRCVSGLCLERQGAAALLQPDFCHAVYPPALADQIGTDDVLLLGTLLPISGSLETRGPGRERAVYMAVDEINEAGGLNNRRLAVLSCDSATDASAATIAADFMANVANVPAVIGCASSGVTIGAFTGAAKDAGMLMMSPSSTSVLITDLADDNLLWRTAPSDSGQGVAIAELLADRDATKVGVVNRDDAYGNSLREVLQASLCLRIDCADNDVYVASIYGDDDRASAQQAALEQLEGLAPDVIVLIAFADDAIAFLRLLESSEVLAETPVVLTDGAKEQRMIQEIGSRALLEGIIGTNPASPDNINSRTFTINYRAKWSEEPTSFAPHSYDAAYVLAYALASIQEGPVTGAKVAAGLQRLAEGPSVDVGPIDFAGAVRQLSTPGGTIDVNGASGPLDFDPATGEALGDIEGWRFDVDAAEIESLGVVYESATRTFISPPPRSVDGGRPDAGEGVDGGAHDAGGGDAGPADAGVSDGGTGS